MLKIAETRVLGLKEYAWCIQAMRAAFVNPVDNDVVGKTFAGSSNLNWRSFYS